MDIENWYRKNNMKKDIFKFFEDNTTNKWRNLLIWFAIHVLVDSFTSNKNWDKENLDVWHALEDAYNEGKVKNIGVSNFHISDLENLMKNATIKPMVNQVLAHIGQTPFEILDYCNKNNILVEAYSPIAHGEAGRIKEVIDIADKYNKPFAQICLKYCLQLGMVALPKASSKEHLLSNLDLDFEISNDDMETLKNAKPLDNYGEHDFFPVFKQSGK